MRGRLFQFAAILFIAVFAFTFFINSGGAEQPVRPDRGAVGTTAGEGPEMGPAGPEPLVNRVLEQLRNGQPTESQDDPTAGAIVPIVAADRGSLNELGQLEIPAIGVKETVNSGVHEEVLKSGPGHWPGTPLPGSRGNSVVSGHRNTNTKPFADLDKLRPGDEITFSAGRRTSTFSVERTVIVDEADYAQLVLEQPADPNQRLLTMFACHPVGSRQQRIVVQASAEVRL